MSVADDRIVTPSRRSLPGGLALLALFAGSVALVRPYGNFPLNDDWNFAMAAWHFAENLEFRFSRLTGMSLKLQVLWGALWTWLFGRSFEVLRASTLFLSAATLLLFWKWTGELGWRGPVRMLIAASLLANPIFFWSSMTFMTQVPFLFCSMLGLYSTWKAYREEKIGWGVAAAVAVLAAALIRQTGIAVALPGLLLPWLDRREGANRRLSLPFAAACVLFAALYAGTDLFDGYPGQIAVHYEAYRGERGWIQALIVPFHHFGTNVQYGALFALPLTAGLLLTRMRPDRRWVAVSLLLSSVPVAVGSWQIARGNPFPYGTGGSILQNIGLGVMTLRDVYFLGYDYPTHLGRFGSIVATALAVLAGAFLLGRAVRGWFESATAPLGAALAVRLGLLHSAAATAILIPSAIYFDRYALDSLWCIPLWAPFLIRWSRPVRVAVAAVLVLLLGFSIAATREYFAWNRARWEAFGWLTDRGVTLREMDGGYEINQYLLGGWDGPERLDKRGFSVVDDEYVIAFNREVRGYEAIHSIPYRGWISGAGAIHVLQRREVDR
ncbi:MAG TPA: hypothetical protein VMS56_07930 [Thermoanaerobaculia bacterium]|nr:hypothetical protein [Thermoanaerobaculia bacterium]